MNYRHAFHAGNFADVFKHVLLTRLLLALQRKPTPFRYIDTHAGIGWYDLDCEEARRSGEWRQGIGQLPMSMPDEPVRALIQPYLEALGPRDPEGRPSRYPGSPAIAQVCTRAQDRLILCEKHPADGVSLRDAMARDRRAKVVALDGYTALKAFVPPPERRGVVLVDPPFESRDEFDAMAEGLGLATRKWPTGVYALWYPIKDREAVLRFTRTLQGLAIERLAQLELIVEAGALARGPLAGCGLVLVNPPFGLEEEVAVLMPYLASALGRQEPGLWRWRSLHTE